MNGSGMPVIGMMPIVMPMFSNTWNANIAEHADADERAEEVGRQQGGSPDAATRAARRAPSSVAPPTKPSSSPTTVKMKSVCCSGT